MSLMLRRQRGFEVFHIPLPISRTRKVCVNNKLHFPILFSVKGLYAPHLPPWKIIYIKRLAQCYDWWRTY